MADAGVGDADIFRLHLKGHSKVVVGKTNSWNPLKSCIEGGLLYGVCA